MFKTYLDESGTHDGSPVVTVGAYVGRPSEWQRFTKEWNLRKRPIRVFHASDCAALQGEFKGWDEDARNKFVANLLPVIGAAKIQGFAVGIVLKDLEKELEKNQRLQTLLSPNPYTACFQWVMHTIVDQKIESLNKSRIAFFHENNDYQEAAQFCYGRIKERSENAGKLLSLTFGAKEDFVPLQAADVLAYECNKRLNTQGTPGRRSPDRRSFTAINPEKIRLRYYDKSNLPGLVSWLAKRLPA